MNRRFISLTLVFIIICAPLLSLAHVGDEHYKEIEKVLFGNKSSVIMGDKQKKEMVRHLQYATNISLDQFNGSSNILFEDLKSLKMKNIPANMTDTIDNGGINFPSYPNEHRKFTHLGWTHTYSSLKQKANWPMRRTILLETVSEVLNQNDQELCNSFAAILYYVHILGDIQRDSTRNEREQVVPLIEKRRTGDIVYYRPDKDIFVELYHYLPILFKGHVSKTYRSYYNSMISQIIKLYSKAKNAMNANDPKLQYENDNNLTADQLHEFSLELLNILSQNMPVLLEHGLFADVFYK